MSEKVIESPTEASLNKIASITPLSEGEGRGEAEEGTRVRPRPVIIKYNAGNIRSVLFALERLGVEAVVTDDEETIRNATHVIFPGVGAAGSAMAYLRERGLDKLIQSLTQPFLGVCLGMQLMCRHSEENDTECLGIFDIEVKKFTPLPPEGGDKTPPSGGRGTALKVPHMGWNSLHALKSPLLAGLNEGDYCYFVHSYYAALDEATIASTPYGIEYSSALHRDNFYGAQFHPEKSAKVGEQILRNFLSF